MGPEDNEKEAAKLYMMVDGQPVEIATEIAEIKLPEDQQGGDNLHPLLEECEFTCNICPSAPLVHGRMIYRCECCGKSWPMYLEKGIEEFGENHKPSPFTIVCPHCGGWASDVSGIQKVPGSGYVPLPDGYGYFANVGNRDCGVPTFLAREAKKEPKRQDKILIADELGGSGVGVMARAIEYLADCMERETREIEEVARMIAERTGVSMEAAEGMVLNVLQRDAGGLREYLEELNSLFDGDSGQKGEFLDLTTAWDRKEAREKLRAVEQETASRFRQHKDREGAWATRKRTRARQREWRGPWRSEKN